MKDKSSFRSLQHIMIGVFLTLIIALAIVGFQAPRYRIALAAGPVLAPAASVDLPPIFVAWWGAVEGKFYALLFLTFLDVFFGVILAIRQKRFSWDHLNDYLDHDVIPMLVWLAVEGISLLPSGIIPEGVTVAIPNAIYAGLFLYILSSFMSHASAFGVATNALAKVNILPTGGPAPDADGSPGGGQ